MKLMFTGIFIASTAAPAALATGFYAFRHMRGGIPGSIDVATATAAILLGLAFFVFMGRLASKGQIRTKPVANSDAWGNQ